MTHKPPMKPSKLFKIIFTIWLSIDIIILAFWKMNFMTNRDLMIGLIIINAQPLATLIIEFFKRKRSLNMPL